MPTVWAALRDRCAKLPFFRSSGKKDGQAELEEAAVYEI